MVITNLLSIINTLFTGVANLLEKNIVLGILLLWVEAVVAKQLVLLGAFFFAIGFFYFLYVSVDK